MALRRHRKPPNLYGSSAPIPEAHAAQLESQNSILRSRRSRHLPPQRSENSRFLSNRHGLRRKLGTSTTVPQLLRSIVLNRVDRVVSTVDSWKPESMAQNRQQRQQQRVLPCSRAASHYKIAVRSALRRLNCFSQTPLNQNLRVLNRQRRNILCQKRPIR